MKLITLLVCITLVISGEAASPLWLRNMLPRADSFECIKTGTFCQDCKNLVMCTPDGSGFKPINSECPPEQICKEPASGLAACVPAKAARSAREDPPAPEPCVCESEFGGKAADPFNPNKYVMCFNGMVISQSCKEGEIFSKESNTCEQGDADAMKCTEPGIKAIVPECTKYLVCYEQNGELKSAVGSCDSGKFYDESIPDCVTEVTTPAPFTECDGKTGLLPDPYECNGYHVCGTGVPADLSKSTQCCSQGYVFSSTKQICVQDDGENSKNCDKVSPCAKDKSNIEFVCKDKLVTASSNNSSTTKSSSNSTTNKPSNSTPKNPSNSTTKKPSNSTTKKPTTAATTVGTGCLLGQRKPYPGNCKKFYYCAKISDTQTQYKVYECSGTLLFSEVYGLCVTASSANCTTN